MIDWGSTLYSIVVHEAAPAVLLVAALRYHASTRARSSLLLVWGAAGQIVVAFIALIVLLAVPAVQDFNGFVLLGELQDVALFAFGLLFAGALISILRDAARNRLRLMAIGSDAAREVTEQVRPADGGARA
jgi:hypothetical protein